MKFAVDGERDSVYKHSQIHQWTLFDYRLFLVCIFSSLFRVLFALLDDLRKNLIKLIKISNFKSHTLPFQRATFVFGWHLFTPVWRPNRSTPQACCRFVCVPNSRWLWLYLVASFSAIVLRPVRNANCVRAFRWAALTTNDTAPPIHRRLVSDC